MSILTTIPIDILILKSFGWSLCCTDTTMLKWTRYVNTWQILKNTHGTCVRQSIRAACYIGWSNINTEILKHGVDNILNPYLQFKSALQQQICSPPFIWRLILVGLITLISIVRVAIKNLENLCFQPLVQDFLLIGFSSLSLSLMVDSEAALSEFSSLCFLLCVHFKTTMKNSKTTIMNQWWWV